MHSKMGIPIVNLSIHCGTGKDRLLLKVSSTLVPIPGEIIWLVNLLEAVPFDEENIKC